MRYWAITHPVNPATHLYCARSGLDGVVKAVGEDSTIVEITQHEYDLATEAAPGSKYWIE
jgi:hypothetical protein